jgi:hypothetical protein
VVEIMSTTAIPGAPDDVVRVFVSYAREDRRWLDRDYRYSLIPFLMDSLRRHNVAFWFDKELKPGDEFRRYIESQIDQSQIALLIVSQSFLNSEFIENREMPRIAERARLGKMIVVPVLVEPCDWSEYPFLADRQMVPSSPLIDYTESEPQWAKIRFQILDGLKAQLKRIREVPQAHSSSAAAQDVAEREAATQAALRAKEEAEQIREQEREAEESRRRQTEQEAVAQAAMRAEEEAEQVRRKQEREAEERRKRENQQEELSLREAAEREVAAQSALRAEKEPDAATAPPASAPVDIPKHANAPTLKATPPDSASEQAVTENRAEIVAPQQERTRVPSRRSASIAAGSALLGLLAFVYLGFSPLADSSVAIAGAVPLVLLVCLLVLNALRRKWVPAVVGGAALAWFLLVTLTPFQTNWHLVIEAAPMAVVLACFQLFKPLPRHWTSALLGGLLVVWLYLVFFAPLSRYLTLATMDWAALTVALVSFRGFRPFPRYWTLAILGGALLMWTYTPAFESFTVISILGVLDVAALALVSACLVVFIVRRDP